VTVAVNHKVGQRCRPLLGSGRLGPVRSCARTRYLRARGTTRFTLRRRVRLPRGAYNVWTRALDRDGTVERKARTRNLRRARIH
jgi:hypothetical protein